MRSGRRKPTGSTAPALRGWRVSGVVLMCLCFEAARCVRFVGSALCAGFVSRGLRTAFREAACCRALSRSLVALQSDIERV